MDALKGKRLFKTLTFIFIALALIEAAVIFQQRQVCKEVEAQSAKILNKFLTEDASVKAGTIGVPIRLQNVKFIWSDKVYINSGNMAVKAVPVSGAVVDFDNLNSFLLNVQQSDVLIRPSVLEGMFNESVFNYPGSKLRDLKVSIVHGDKHNNVKLTGSLDFILWIPFEMLTNLAIDKTTNTLVIDVQDIKVFGFIPANGLIELKPFHLQKLMSLPANRYLTVDQNRMMVKPFGLFPPPRINGTMSDIVVGEQMIRLSFSGNSIDAPRANSANYVYVKGGRSKFGNFQMLNSDILVEDQSPATPFSFSLQHYADMIPRSQVTVKNTDAARVVMPDFASR